MSGLLYDISRRKKEVALPQYVFLLHADQVCFGIWPRPIPPLLIDKNRIAWVILMKEYSQYL